MSNVTSEIRSPVNHVFVDYENVQEIDLDIIGRKAVSFMLLMGPRQTKLDATLVEKLLAHADSVELVRLASSGKNALDFALAYYIGRAAAADPTGYFHIVSKDTGYDPLIEHLASKHIRVQRHATCATLTFGGPAKPAPPASSTAASKVKSPAKPKVQSPILDEREMQVLEHFRNPKATRPRSEQKLISFLVAHLGHKITEVEVFAIIEKLQRAGHIAIGEKGAVTYNIK